MKLRQGDAPTSSPPCIGRSTATVPRLSNIIVNDAHDWAIETMGNAKYPLELFLRVITVSLETMKVVEGLPALDIG